MKRVFFYINNTRVEAFENLTILEVALSKGFQINHSCGGNGTCGTCLVKIENPNLLPPRNEIESDMAEDRQFDLQERLACQNHICKDIKVDIKG